MKHDYENRIVSDCVVDRRRQFVGRSIRIDFWHSIAACCYLAWNSHAGLHLVSLDLEQATQKPSEV